MALTGVWPFSDFERYLSLRRFGEASRIRWKVSLPHKIWHKKKHGCEEEMHSFWLEKKASWLLLSSLSCGGIQYMQIRRLLCPFLWLQYDLCMTCTTNVKLPILLSVTCDRQIEWISTVTCKVLLIFLIHQRMLCFQLNLVQVRYKIVELSGHPKKSQKKLFTHFFRTDDQSSLASGCNRTNTTVLSVDHFWFTLVWTHVGI